ncbi:MAG: Clp protease N-terminal domain-containing protein, partial [Weeksellaceae bacterium]|nr:Clp protease N-terminal domain-containing protein [Weeksellaceae bacterium]
MNDNFSQKVKDVIAYSKEEALRLGHNQIGTEHLLLGILREGDSKAVAILESLDTDLKEIREKIEILAPPHENFSSKKQNLQLTKQAERALKTTFLEAKLFKNTTVNSVHLLLCILRNENDPTTKLLKNLNIDYTSVKNEFN